MSPDGRVKSFIQSGKDTVAAISTQPEAFGAVKLIAPAPDYTLAGESEAVVVATPFVALATRNGIPVQLVRLFICKALPVKLVQLSALLMAYAEPFQYCI